MAYPTVTIDGNVYDVYANVATADVRLGGSVSADSWRTASADAKARALVSSTRWIDSGCWLGDKTDPAQTLEFPRAPDIAVPTAVVNACIDLAALLIDNPLLAQQMTGGGAPATDGGTKRLKAGSAEIEYFKYIQANEVGGNTGMFPAAINSSLAIYMCDDTKGFNGGSIASGVCDRTQFERDKFGFYRGF